MEVNIPEKVLKYETFLNDVLKEELKKIHTRLDVLQTEAADLVQLKCYIETLKDAELTEEPLKSQVDIGCGFFLQANIDDPKKILVELGCGYYVEFSLDEALVNIRSRLDLLDKQTQVYRGQSANTKAHIKMVLLGLMELQNLK
ncbi:protein UXT homolog [Cimex lectularius]|uniref:Protein UXT n=1 Tax=Cimex lectularius TaxID=79782 RepID=A0A8I6S470_CIMLE|nr:protein UXT homolog [Cimex lectularius]